MSQKYTKKWFIDTTERTAKTFVQGYLLAWLVFQDKTWEAFWNLENVKAGIVGGVLSLAMALVGANIGSGNTAAWLPKEEDTERGRAELTLILLALVCGIIGYLIGNYTATH